MTGLFAAGGLWNIVITLLGASAIGVAALQLRAGRRRDDRDLIVGLTCATFLVSVLGYGLGMWEASKAVDFADPGPAAAKMLLAQAYASTALAWGGLMATVAALFGAVAAHRARGATIGSAGS